MRLILRKSLISCWGRSGTTLEHRTRSPSHCGGSRWAFPRVQPRKAQLCLLKRLWIIRSYDKNKSTGIKQRANRQQKAEPLLQPVFTILASNLGVVGSHLPVFASPLILHRSQTSPNPGWGSASPASNKPFAPCYKIRRKKKSRQIKKYISSWLPPHFLAAAGTGNSSISWESCSQGSPGLPAAGREALLKFELEKQSSCLARGTQEQNAMGEGGVQATK